MFTRKDARDITDRVLSLSKADEAFVSLSSGTSANLRFARNVPSTSGSAETPSLSIASTFGTRTGSVTTNQFDDISLAEAVRRSEEIARLAPEDPEHMPVLGPQSHVEVNAFSAETAQKGPEALAEGVGLCLGQARDAGVTAAGFTETRARQLCIASSRGLFGYHRDTNAYLAMTARTTKGDGSGWASASSTRIADIDYGEVARVAIAKARASVEPRPIEPGSYVTILEPACVANLMSLLSWNMDTRRADEGRSYFSAPQGGSRKGEKLFAPSVDLYSDPVHAAAPGVPWGSEGLPQARRSWIAKGVLENLHIDRFWAQKSGVEPVPPPSNLILSGGQGTVEDLIATTRRGLLVTSLWYIRSVDPRSLLFTGLTRDGVFWIEDGKIAYPVKNLRWNESVAAVLKNVDAMSASLRVPPRPGRQSTYVVPALRLKSFSFTSTSDAV
jgi:predicted Zn-dependent protease